MEEEFKLVGILNKLDVLNEFVYPVYEYENKYYLQSSDTLNTIESFEVIVSEIFTKSIKPLEECKLVNPCNKTTFKIGDEALYGIEFPDSKVFLGTFEELKQLVSTTKFDDDYLDIEAPYFVKTTEEQILELKKAGN